MALKKQSTETINETNKLLRQVMVESIGKRIEKDLNVTPLIPGMYVRMQETPKKLYEPMPTILDNPILAAELALTVETTFLGQSGEITLTREEIAEALLFQNNDGPKARNVVEKIEKHWRKGSN